MIKALKSILRPFVQTLVYFSSPDLMVEVTYKKIRNSIKYASHREMLFRERFGVEHYLVSNLAVKMGYYKSQPAMLKYTGVDTSLLRELSHVHSIDTPPSINSTETQVEDAVKALIDQSLSNYYFEQIGNVLLEIRLLSGSLEPGIGLGAQTERLRELVEAYNLHIENKVSLDEIVPEELRGYLK